MPRPANPVTTTLSRIRAGEAQAAEELLPQVYDELRVLAQARLRKLPPGQTLHATALVHESYLKLVGEEDPGWDGRRHFFGAAARAMRYLMVDEIRQKKRLKRGGAAGQSPLHESRIAGAPAEYELLELQDALEQLYDEDPRKARVVDLRFFAGLSVVETAEMLAVSTRTVENDWAFARAWLKRAMSAPAEREAEDGD